jgi:hypothetical protein
MARALVAAALFLWLGPAALAQQPLPAPSAAVPEGQRIFCGQPVAVRLAAQSSVPQRYRGFIGIFSDASWTPALCAALIVENVTPQGLASIVYVFGPMNADGRGPGGVLHGTGVIRDDTLRFQNSDGSQFLFRPLYADLEGRFTTPKGQRYGAIFKRAL